LGLLCHPSGSRGRKRDGKGRRGPKEKLEGGGPLFRLAWGGCQAGKRKDTQKKTRAVKLCVVKAGRGKRKGKRKRKKKTWGKKENTQGRKRGCALKLRHIKGGEGGREKTQEKEEKRVKRNRYAKIHSGRCVGYPVGIDGRGKKARKGGINMRGMSRERGTLVLIRREKKRKNGEKKGIERPAAPGALRTMGRDEKSCDAPNKGREGKKKEREKEQGNIVQREGVKGEKKKRKKKGKQKEKKKKIKKERTSRGCVRLTQRGPEEEKREGGGKDHEKRGEGAPRTISCYIFVAG